MPSAKEVFPLAILGTRVIGLSALVYADSGAHKTSNQWVEGAFPLP
jgi:hypothetical protein